MDLLVSKTFGSRTDYRVKLSVHGKEYFQLMAAFGMPECLCRFEFENIFVRPALYSITMERSYSHWYCTCTDENCLNQIYF